MAVRERRSLWGSISQSKKVNALSDRAIILYVFTMVQLDDEGFIDGDPRTLKSTSVPLRDDIPLKDIEKLIYEISTVHKRVQSSPKPLWIIHKTSQGVFIQDPYFNERQSFKGIRKKHSDIKDVVNIEASGKQEVNINKTNRCLSEGKGEVKGNVKRSEGEGEGETPNTSMPKTWGKQLVNIFNEVTHYLPKVSSIDTKQRIEHIIARMRENKSFDWWKNIFIEADTILIPGKDGKKDWFPNFDWLIKNDTNAVKVFEGNYRDAKRPPQPFKPQPGIIAFVEEERKKRDGL